MTTSLCLVHFHLCTFSHTQDRTCTNSMFCWYHDLGVPEPYNHRIVEVGRHLWRSSDPKPCSKARSSREGCSEPCPVEFWTTPRRETTTSLGNLFYCLITLTVNKVFLMFKYNFLNSSLCHCFLPCHKVPPTRTWLCLLYSLPSCIYTHW